MHQREHTIEIPSSFEEAYHTYYDYVVTLVKKFGIVVADAEDVASYIWTRFYERKALDFYDPDHESAVVFKSFLYGFTAKYVLHFRKRQARRQAHEGWSTDYMIHEDSFTKVPWGEANLHHIDSHETFEFVDLLLPQIYERLDAYDPGNRIHDSFDLHLLFDMVLLQWEESERLNLAELARLFGVTAPTISTWMKILRGEIQAVLGA